MCLQVVYGHISSKKCLKSPSIIISLLFFLIHPKPDQHQTRLPCKLLGPVPQSQATSLKRGLIAMLHTTIQPARHPRAAGVHGLVVAAGLGILAGSIGSLALAQGVPEAGFKIMTAPGAGNCLACHTLPNPTGISQAGMTQTGIPSTFGPPLNQVGNRYSAVALRQWVVDARQIKPDTLMPPFGTLRGITRPNLAQPMLSDADIDHVVSALQTLK